MCPFPNKLQHLYGHALGRMSENSDTGVLFRKVRMTDLDFANNALIFAETTEVLSETLESLSEEARPLELRISEI